MPLLESIPSVLYQSILPICIMLTLERISLYKLSRTQKGKDWVRSKFWLHPNFISRCRYPMGVVSVLFYHIGTIYQPDSPGSIWHHIGIMWFAFWMITDITDGTIARHFQLGSPEGESIDPLSDKLLIFPPLLYFSFYNLIPLYYVLIFLLFDVIGTFSRFFIKNKAANLFGKAKTFFAAFTLVLITMQQIYYPEFSWNISMVTLISAVFFSFFSVFFKVIPNYWYANILSLLNLICGLTGIFLVVYLNHIAIAFALVFLGQFLDLFDGRAADRWGSTPKGELMDDIADGTNFGLTISIIIWAAFDKSTLGIVLGFLHSLCTFYRLYRFIKNKHKAGVKGGVKVFSGLPSPAGAMVSGSVVLLHANEYFRVGIVILTSLLMISTLPYIHFGRVILKSIPKMIQVVLLIMIIMAVWVGSVPGNIQILYWAVFIFSTIYLVLGYSWKRYDIK